jgi:beta-phosphoglucomutase
MKEFAVIFDIDGTMVDNIGYHIIALKMFCERHGRHVTDEEFKQHISGKTTKEVMNYVFRTELSESDIKRYNDEKEGIYRDIYRPHMKPSKGLIGFLEMLKKNKIKIGIATAGPEVNMRYIFEGINIEKYIDAWINGDMIINGKPHPEIYLRAAEMLNISPSKCIVVEDSILGIQSGRNAGMKIIAITNVHPREELNSADYIIEDFESMSIQDLNKILE